MNNPQYIVVTEHWPRNPSKPMWFHVDSKPFKSAVTARGFADCVRVQNKKKKSRLLGETYVVQIIPENELQERITEEANEVQRAIKNS